MNEFAIAFLGAVAGAVATGWVSWSVLVQNAQQRLALVLYKLEHAFNHHDSEDPYPVMTNDVVFDLWDAGMSYVVLFPFGLKRKLKERIERLLGLMGTIEGDTRKHSLTGRSLPSSTDAKTQIDQIFADLGYKKARIKANVG